MAPQDEDLGNNNEQGSSDDNDDVSVPSSDEEDALIPDESWIYSTIKTKRLQKEAESNFQCVKVNSSENVRRLQTSTSVDSCYGFFRNVLRRLSSQPSPNSIDTEDFPYTLPENIPKYEHELVKSPLVISSDSTVALSTEKTNDNCPNTLTMELTKDVIELRNLDDDLEKVFGQPSCPLYIDDLLIQCSTSKQSLASDSDSEKDKGIVRSFSDFFRKLPTLWDKRSSLPVSSSAIQRSASNDLKERPNSIGSYNFKISRSKTTATCTENFEMYPCLESVEEDSCDEEQIVCEDKEDYKSKRIKSDLRKLSLLTKDDIINANMRIDSAGWYYNDEEEEEEEDIPYFEECTKCTKSSKKNRSNSKRFNSLTYEENHYSNPIHSSRKNDKKDSICQMDNITMYNKDDLSTCNASAVPAIDYCEAIDLIEDSYYTETCDNNQLPRYEFLKCSNPKTKKVVQNDIADISPDHTRSTSTKRTMNDDIEEVFMHLKTMKFDEWSGSPKKRKRISYPTTQMVSSRTAGPFYDSDDEDFEEEEVILSSYYSMPELYKLTDYYQKHIAPNKNYSRSKTTTATVNEKFIDNRIIKKDSLENIIFDYENEFDMVTLKDNEFVNESFENIPYQMEINYQNICQIDCLHESQTASFEEVNIYNENSIKLIPSSLKNKYPNTQNEDKIECGDIKTAESKSKHGKNVRISTILEEYPNNEVIICDENIQSDEDSYFKTSLLPISLDEENSSEDFKHKNKQESIFKFGIDNSVDRLETKINLNKPTNMNREFIESEKFRDVEVKDISPKCALNGIEDETLTHNAAGLQNRPQKNILSGVSNESHDVVLQDKEQSAADNSVLSSKSSKSCLFLPETNLNLNHFHSTDNDVNNLASFCKDQNEMITVDEIFSFKDIYADLKTDTGFESDTVSASTEQDECLKDTKSHQTASAFSDLENEIHLKPDKNQRTEKEHELIASNELTKHLANEPVNEVENCNINTDFFNSEKANDTIAHCAIVNKSYSSSTLCHTLPDICHDIAKETVPVLINADVHSLQSDLSGATFQISKDGIADPLYGHVNDPSAKSSIHRYYHCFQENELEQMIEQYVDDLHVLQSFKHHSSWCVIAEKVQVWTI